MGRLGLIIADTDEEYGKSLADYLMVHYSHRFRISTFSEYDSLRAFLEKTRADAVLAAECIFNKLSGVYGTGAVIMLSEGDPVKRNGIAAVNKYQPAEQLVSQILSILSECLDRELEGQAVTRTAKTVAFHSPGGGSPKTAAVAAAAIYCARKGLKVFYLCLESIQNTGIFFSGSGSSGLTDMIFQLKDSYKNLALKLEGYKSFDKQYGVHFLSPPECPLDMGELLNTDVEELIRTLKYSGDYELVLVELSSDLNRQTLSAFYEADDIMLFCGGDEIAVEKVIVTLQNLKRIAKRDGCQIDERLTIVVEHGNNADGSRFEGVRCFEYHGFCANCAEAVQPGTEFYGSIGRIVESLQA